MNRLSTVLTSASVGALVAAAITAPAHFLIGPAHATTAPTEVVASATRALPDFSTLVEREGAAVVNISTARLRTAANSSYDPRSEPGVPMPQIRQGVGSGFIVSADGLVLTNAHVVDGASEVTVRLTDKRELKARVLGSDRRTDVALLKVEATGLPTVRLGDPSRTRVGEWAVAIGSPFGFENTVTAGIVSAKSRSLPGDGYVPFIQTDVAINPGNSGGPLFNLAGEVIGINSQIYSRSGGYQGLAFAIPIDVALKIRDDLVKFGKVQRGRLGVSIQQVSRDLADSFGMPKPVGALVNNVEPNSPAASAGLRSGDVVVAINSRRVEQSADLPRFIGELRPGDTVAISVWRDGAERTLRARLSETPADRIARTDR
ncbi:MAG: Do family serine endopeptidase [Burkholderiales bacterium]